MKKLLLALLMIVSVGQMQSASAFSLSEASQLNTANTTTVAGLCIKGMIFFNGEERNSIAQNLENFKGHLQLVSKFSKHGNMAMIKLQYSVLKDALNHQSGLESFCSADFSNRLNNLHTLIRQNNFQKIDQAAQSLSVQVDQLTSEI